MTTTTMTLDERNVIPESVLQLNNGIPTPALLEQYKEIDPNLPDQIMMQCTENREKALKAENARIRSQKVINLLSIILTAVIAVAGIILTGLMFILGGRIVTPIVAIAFALISVLPMIAFFIFHRSAR